MGWRVAHGFTIFFFSLLFVALLSGAPNRKYIVPIYTHVCMSKSEFASRRNMKWSDEYTGCNLIWLEPINVFYLRAISLAYHIFQRAGRRVGHGDRYVVTVSWMEIIVLALLVLWCCSNVHLRHCGNGVIGLLNCIEGRQADDLFVGSSTITFSKVEFVFCIAVYLRYRKLWPIRGRKFR